MSNVADENRAFLKIRSDREAQQAHRELITVLEKFPADQGESVITKALEELADLRAAAKAARAGARDVDRGAGAPSRSA